MPSDPIDLLRALEMDEFVPFFQPLIELRTGQLAGFEVLARWVHPRRGVLLPDEFIPCAEKNGLIDKMTQSILEKTFASPVVAQSSFTVAVNISPIQLMDFKLPERIAAAAGKAGFSLRRLIIEITESALLDDLRRAQSVAQEFKALDCRLALDDFGTGYSSLKHLHALPFGELKVDRSFVNSMASNRDSRKIVASVVGLGQSLGLVTVAEGVETKEQAEMLFRMGCDLGQGWLFGRPLPEADLARLVADIAHKAPLSLLTTSESSIVLDGMPAHRLAQLEAIYNGAPVGLCLLDRNMRYVSLNRHLALLNGALASEHLGKTPAEIIPDVFRQVEPFIRRALAGEAVTGIEARKPGRGINGSTQTLMLSYQPVRDEAEEVVGVSVAVVDISERKQVEEALRESEEHFRSMVQLSPHVPWVLNTRGEVIEASTRWTAITGQSIEDALGDGWIKVLHPYDIAGTRAAIVNTLKTGAPIDVKYRVRTPTGNWLWMHSRGAPRIGPSGEVIGIYGVVEEIDAAERLSLELEVCDERMRAALDVIPLAMIVADAGDGKISVVNRAAKEIFGDVVASGQTIPEYRKWGIAAADGRVLEANGHPLAAAIVRGEAVDMPDLHFTAADGSTRNIDISAKPIYGLTGQLLGAVMSARILPPEASK